MRATWQQELCRKHIRHQRKRSAAEYGPSLMGQQEKGLECHLAALSFEQPHTASESKSGRGIQAFAGS